MGFRAGLIRGLRPSKKKKKKKVELTALEKAKLKAFTRSL